MSRDDEELLAILENQEVFGEECRQGGIFLEMDMATTCLIKAKNIVLECVSWVLDSFRGVTLCLASVCLLDVYVEWSAMSTSLRVHIAFDDGIVEESEHESQETDKESYFLQQAPHIYNYNGTKCCRAGLDLLEGVHGSLRQVSSVHQSD